MSQSSSSCNPNLTVQGLFCYEGVASVSLGEALRSWSNSAELKEIYLFIGSEGGFSDREVQLFQGHSLAPVTLGEQILRVETACLAVISIIKYQMKVYG